VEPRGPPAVAPTAQEYNDLTGGNGTENGAGSHRQTTVHGKDLPG